MPPHGAKCHAVLICCRACAERTRRASPCYSRECPGPTRRTEARKPAPRSRRRRTACFRVLQTRTVACAGLAAAVLAARCGRHGRSDADCCFPRVRMGRTVCSALFRAPPLGRCVVKSALHAMRRSYRFALSMSRTHRERAAFGCGSTPGMGNDPPDTKSTSPGALRGPECSKTAYSAVSQTVQINLRCAHIIGRAIWLMKSLKNLVGSWSQGPCVLARQAALSCFQQRKCSAGASEAPAGCCVDHHG